VLSIAWLQGNSPEEVMMVLTELQKGNDHNVNTYRHVHRYKGNATVVCHNVDCVLAL
jgi:hypothetical protein